MFNREIGEIWEEHIRNPSPNSQSSLLSTDTDAA
jgi:hypothetical protein